MAVHSARQFPDTWTFARARAGFAARFVGTWPRDPPLRDRDIGWRVCVCVRMYMRPLILSLLSAGQRRELVIFSRPSRTAADWTLACFLFACRTSAVREKRYATTVRNYGARLMKVNEKRNGGYLRACTPTAAKRRRFARSAPETSAKRRTFLTGLIFQRKSPRVDRSLAIRLSVSRWSARAGTRDPQSRFLDSG